MSVQDKIPNLETQKRIATALESLAKTLSPSSLQTYIDERINAKRLETYPVGYVWVSFSETNPSEIVGGTWELVTDKPFVDYKITSYKVTGTLSGKAISSITAPDGYEFIAHLQPTTDGFVSASYTNPPSDQNMVIWTLNPPSGSKYSVTIFTLWGRRFDGYMFRRTA